MKRARSSKNNFFGIKEIGHIYSFFAGVGKVKGLPNVGMHEVLIDQNGKEIGIVIGFDEEFVDVLFFDTNIPLNKPVFRSFRPFSINVSDACIGRVIDGVGKPLDNLGELTGEKYPVFRSAPSIIEREPVSVPLTTGIKLIDITLPIGRGQRELIIGDRKLGKSTIAIDIVLNQKYANPPVYCIYVICGQKQRKLHELIDIFNRYEAFTYSTIVSATSDNSFASLYLAPFIGTTIGEYFRDNGKDALIVYDDLSKHAKIYRDISLILERAPGREAYPGDIFSLHAGLLERSAKLCKKKKGGSLTALPIVETQEGDITSFISTNLISITDGQIYLEKGLFEKGFLPAINIGLSVSRIGGKAQPKPLRKVSEGIRLSLAQHKELQKLSQLETTLSIQAQKRVFRGELILELLKQKKHTNIPWPQQTILVYAVEQGFFDDIEKSQWSEFENLLLELIKNKYFNILEKIKNGIFNHEIKQKINKIITDFKQEFLLTKEENI
ncbi:F0F1 ATP synthase subunit alpha [bacterium]|nr:F0F1 ATP synthase subunit alpha [bacterium]